MKRPIAILLLIVCTYSFLGAGFVYNIWLYSLKKEVKQKLKKELPEESAIIKIPASWVENPPQQFQWHEEHEFRYRGQMYDIIRQERHGDQIWYYCHWDKAETELLNNLSEYVSSHLHQHPEKQHKNALLNIILDQTFQVTRLGINVYPPPERISTFTQYSLSPEFYPDIKVPPPRYTMSC